MATIDIYGIIGQDSWWERSCNTTKAVSERLDRIPDGEEITVRINSLGGNVVEGLGIYNLLKARGESVTTVIVGCAASMAGVIFCAGATAIAPETSLLMIHSPSSIIWGTAEEMRQEAETLDVMRSAMVAAYVEKSGMSEDEVLALMSKDSWMTGAEAAAMGFCEVGEVEVVESPDDEMEDDGEYLMMFGSASADKKILKFPDTLKLPAAKERKKFEKLGWRFEQAAMGDRFVASAVAAPPVPKVSPTKAKPTDKKEKDKPKMTDQQTPQATVPVVPSSEIPAEFTAKLEAAEAEAKAKSGEAEALKAENERLQRNLTVTAQYFELKQKAVALRSEDLKLKPAKFNALFGGERASIESLLASPQLDNHLFHIREALAEAETESAPLPTSFRVAEEIEDALPAETTTRVSAGESPESVKAHQRIIAKAKELGVDPNTRDGYLKAMTAVGYNG